VTTYPSQFGCSIHSERVFQLPFAHFRASLDLAGFCLGVEFLAGVSVSLAGAAERCLVSASRLFAGIFPRHRFGALALSIGAKMRLTLALLLPGTALGLFALGSPQVATIAPVAFVFRCSGLFEGNGNGLTTALDLAASATRPLLSSPCLNSCMTLPVIRF